VAAHVLEPETKGVVKPAMQNVNFSLHNSMNYGKTVVRVYGFRSRGAGSIPGATTTSEKQWVWNRVYSAS
jgi:hypothetical protein